MAGAIISVMTRPALAKSFLCWEKPYETRNGGLAKAASVATARIGTETIGAGYLLFMH